MSGYTLNNEIWPGAAKVVEETAELLVNIGKLQSNFGSTDYYDGTDLWGELADEVADSFASLYFFMTENDFDQDYIENRINRKLALYYEWKASNQ